MKKKIEKPEITFVKFEAMNVIATSNTTDVESTGVTMSTSRGYVKGTFFE